MGMGHQNVSFIWDVGVGFYLRLNDTLLDTADKPHLQSLHVYLLILLTLIGLCVRQSPGSGSGLSAPRPQCPNYLLLSSERHFNTCLLFQFPIKFPFLIESRGLQNFITLLKSLTDKLFVQKWCNLVLSAC